MADEMSEKKQAMREKKEREAMEIAVKMEDTSSSLWFSCVI